MSKSQVPLFDAAELPVPQDAVDEQQLVRQVAHDAGYGDDADIDPDTGRTFN